MVQKAAPTPQRGSPLPPAGNQGAPVRGAPRSPRVSIQQLGSLHVPDLANLQTNHAQGQNRRPPQSQGQREQGNREQGQRQRIQGQQHWTHGQEQGQQQHGQRQQGGGYQNQTVRDQRSGSQRSPPGRAADSRQPRNSTAANGGQRLTSSQRLDRSRRMRKEQEEDEEDDDNVNVGAATNYHIDLGDVDMFGAAAEDTANRATKTALAVRASSPVAGLVVELGPRQSSEAQRIREAAAGDYSRRLPKYVTANANIGEVKPITLARSVMGRNPTLTLTGRDSAASIIRKVIPPDVVASEAKAAI
jgi:hypothetical protein